MPLRRRLTVVAAAAVAVAVALACVVAYLAVRDELRTQIDDTLTAQADRASDPGELAQLLSRSLTPQQLGELRQHVGSLPPRRGGTAPYTQLVSPDGQVLLLRGTDVTLPVGARTRQAVVDGGPRFFSDARAGGLRLRMLTVPLVGGGVIQYARSVDSIDAVLAHMRLILLLVALGGIALAAFLGWLVSRNVAKPIVAVTEAARHIAATEDLGRRIEVSSQDEVGELAQHFNAMLATLEGSISAQRQLIADASHELRTPITSLRTNVEVLADADGLAGEERARLLEDVEEQVAELGALVTDVIELARGDRPRRETEDVRLDDLVAEAVARARRHAPRVRFETTLQPAVLEGARERLARAVNNLLDNAAKHAGAGGLVEVAAGPFGLRVRDHGAGIDPADLPHLFDRFYRGASARGLPGSGLGLAIVRQVASQHGGGISAANAPGGGAVFTLALPAVALPGAAGPQLPAPDEHAAAPPGDDADEPTPARAAPPRLWGP